MPDQLPEPASAEKQNPHFAPDFTAAAKQTIAGDAAPREGSLGSPAPCARPGYKTSEFYFTLAVALANFIGAFAGVVPPKYAAVLGTVSAQIYLFVRIAHKAKAAGLLPDSGDAFADLAK